jgi:hypothetical protein
MNGETQIGLTRVGEGDVLVRNFYALHVLDLVELLANILRYGGHGLREDIEARYTARTVDLLVVELDEHASLLRRATTPARKDTP